MSIVDERLLVCLHDKLYHDKFLSFGVWDQSPVYIAFLYLPVWRIRMVHKYIF